MEDVKIEAPTANGTLSSGKPKSSAKPSMQLQIQRYSKRNPWLLPAIIAFAAGMGLAIAGNLLFGSQIEAIGIIVGAVLLVLFLALMGLVFYVLHLIQQRARWQNENFQIALKAKLELDRELQMAEIYRKRQELTAELQAKARGTNGNAQ